MSNPTGTTYLQANPSYVWTNGDVYQIPQTDTVEGAATGASFSGIGVENQPHIVLLNKIQWLYNHLTTSPRGMQVLTDTNNFTVPAPVTTLFVRCWGAGGIGGASVSNSAGGGGGGGGYCESALSVTPGTAIPYSVGVSVTTFSTLSAYAGGTGQPGTGSAAAAFAALASPTVTVFSDGIPGVGGAATGGLFNQRGVGGESGRLVAVPYGYWLVSGEGGASFGCGHGRFEWLGPGGVAGDGKAGVFPGQGGGGGVNGGQGGFGSAGLIIVTW